MLKILTICSFISLLAGCALPTLDQGTIGALKGKTVVRVVPPTQKMGITTTAAETKAGKPGGIAHFDFPNPSLALSAKLTEQLSQRYGTKTEGTVLAQAAPGAADYSLHVTTSNLNMAYYMTSPSHYRILFLTYVTLIDNKTQKPVSTGVCQNQPDQTPASATYEEMLANDGERAKRELAAGVDFCAQKLQRELFSM
jgi:hypothetical protein